MSPELETLDQLIGGDLPLIVLRRFYSDDLGFNRGLSGLLRAGEVRLSLDGMDVPEWRWREVLANPDKWSTLRAHLTSFGARRIGS